MSAVEAQTIVAERLAARAANLATTLRDAVYARPRSPYRHLLRWAGAELGDVERGLADDGVEATLGALFDAGVRVSFEEWKGIRPIVRGGRELPVSASDFDNPLVRSGLPSASSGTLGPPSRTYHDLGHILETVPFRLLSAEAHGMRGAPMAFWFAPPPSIAGINSSLAGVVMGYAPERWFAPVAPGYAEPPRFHRLASRLFFALARLHGTVLPEPEPVPLDGAEPIVEWALGALARAGRCEIRAFASTAMHIATAALRQGADLTGARLLCGGEAASPAKQRLIESCGARMVSYYGSAECGPIAITCPESDDARDLHLSSDRLAMLERPVRLAGWDFDVPGLFVTGLLPGAPKVMLNVETDDCGTLGESACGCALSRWGLGTRLHDVRSYRRLSGGRVTLVPDAARRALEELLPATFGGTPLDYQLQEEDGGEDGPRLALRVAPGVSVTDESRLANCLRDTLVACASGTDGVACWRHDGPLDILRQRPLISSGGKQLPIVVARVATGSPRGAPSSRSR
jgi:hypothetical protein